MFPYISITVPSYSVMAFLGAFFTMIFFYCRSKAFGIEFDDFIKLFVACIVGCILGAKLLFLMRCSYSASLMCAVVQRSRIERCKLRTLKCALVVNR